jgi:hypothetical protein
MGDRNSVSHASPVSPPGLVRKVGSRRLLAGGLWLVPLGALLIGLHWLFPEGLRTADTEALHFSSPITVFVQEFLLFYGGLIALLFGHMALGD